MKLCYIYFVTETPVEYSPHHPENNALKDNINSLLLGRYERNFKQWLARLIHMLFWTCIQTLCHSLIGHGFFFACMVHEIKLYLANDDVLDLI